MHGIWSWRRPETCTDRTANEEDLKDNIASQIIFILHTTQKTVRHKEVGDFSW